MVIFNSGIVGILANCTWQTGQKDLQLLLQKQRFRGGRVARGPYSWFQVEGSFVTTGGALWVQLLTQVK